MSATLRLPSSPHTRAQRADHTPEALFALLYAQHSSMVRHRAAELLWNGSALDAVVDEVFIRFIKASRRRRAYPTRQRAPLLYELTTQVALRHLRGMRRGLAPQPGVGPLEVLAVKRVLAQVAPEVANLAAFAYFDGLSINALAERLEVTPVQVAQNLQRFAETARSVLQQPGWVVAAHQPRARAYEAWRLAGLQPRRSSRCLQPVTLHQMASGERGVDVGAQAHLLRCQDCRSQLRTLRAQRESVAAVPASAAVLRQARRGVEPSLLVSVVQEAVPLTLLAAGLVTATLIMF